MHIAMTCPMRIACLHSQVCSNRKMLVVTVCEKDGLLACQHMCASSNARSKGWQRTVRRAACTASVRNRARCRVWSTTSAPKQSFRSKCAQAHKSRSYRFSDCWRLLAARSTSARGRRWIRSVEEIDRAVGILWSGYNLFQQASEVICVVR